MKRSKNELGSLHVIIIAVLFIALMTLLGIVFYQNFVDKKPTTTGQEDKKPAVTTPQEVTKRLAFNSDIYAFDYQDNWKVETVKDEKSAMDGSTTTVTNPDGTVQVSLTISETVPENSCDTKADLKISAYEVSDMVSNNNLAGIPLYLVESLSDNVGGGYQYKIGLTPDGGDTHAAIGQTYCNVDAVGTALTALVKDKKLVHPTILASIEFPKLPATPKAAAKDMQTIKDLMSTDDYKKAVKVLESARKE